MTLKLTGIHSAEDYLTLWQSICSKVSQIDFSDSYFHHAERYTGGKRSYCRDDIIASSLKDFTVQQRDDVGTTYAIQSGNLRGQYLVSCGMEWQNDHRLLALAEVVGTRIKREWVFTSKLVNLAAKQAGINYQDLAISLPEVSAYCGVSKSDLQDESAQLLTLLQHQYNQSNSQRLVVERVLYDNAQMCLLWRLISITDGYSNCQGISYLQLHQGQVGVQWSLPQLPSNLIPSASTS